MDGWPSISTIVGFAIILGGWIWYASRLKKTVDDHDKSITDIQTSVQKIMETHDQIRINTNRLDAIESEKETAIQKALERGKFLTEREHTEICRMVCQNIANIFTDRFNSFESNMDLKLKNVELSILANRTRNGRRGKNNEEDNHSK